MRKYLLPQVQTYYKANLHCHSTLSDGHFTPEELKRSYKEAGYQILAISDHRIMTAHKELWDEDFIALTSYEHDFNVTDREHFELAKTSHLNLIADDPDKADWNPKDWGNIYDKKAINRFAKAAADSGFFVTHNHPVWSLETPDDCLDYGAGVSAFEIYNTRSNLHDGLGEENPNLYDTLLRAGKHYSCLATDDNHETADEGGGFVMIGAKEFTYASIMEALHAGNFYASCGPVIHALYTEDKLLHVTCSDAKCIRFGTDNRRGRRIVAESGETLHGGTFEIKSWDTYVRVEVTDYDGKKAYTNAYFL